MMAKCKNPTITVQDIEWRTQCSNCDYENHYRRLPGESLGSVIDQILVQFIETCPRCGGKTSDK